MNQKTRDEISNEYKWDLSVIYKNIDEFNKDLESITKEIEKLDNYKNNLMNSSSNLYECLKLERDISRKIEKIYTYAHLNFDSDTSNSIYQDLYGKVTNLYQIFSEKTAYINPTILKNDYSLIEKYYEEEPGLKEFEIGLKEVFRYKPHTLSENEEQLISRFDKVFSRSSKTYEALTDTDMTYGQIKDENNNLVELTDSNYSKYIKSNDRIVRKEAFECLYKAYKQFQNTITSTYTGDIEATSSIAKIRKFNSSIEASLFNDDVNIDVYNNLINTVSNNFEPLFNYYKLKTKILGLDELHLYDTYVSVINEKPKEYSFDEAKNLVINALSVFG